MYCLVQDDSCHWFVIPVNKQEDWADSVCSEFENGVPRYAQAVGGCPSLVEFKEFVIK